MNTSGNGDPDFRRLEDAFTAINQERDIQQAVTDPEECLRILKTAPGIDPVLATAKGESDSLPSTGWFVTAQVTPDYGGVAELFSLPQGALAHHDTYQKDNGDLAAFFDIKGQPPCHIIYENPTFPYTDIEPYERQGTAYASTSFEHLEAREIPGGGRLLIERPTTWKPDSTLSLGHPSPTRLEATPKSFQLNRVTSDPEEMKIIFAHLGFGMGMSAEGLVVLSNAVTEVMQRAQAA